MKKTIIASAIAAAVAAPAAFADVSVSGNVYAEATDSNAQVFTDLFFKASEDLGNGMKVSSMIQIVGDNDSAMTTGNHDGAEDGDGSLTASHAVSSKTAGYRTVALSGDFGTITAGRMEANIEQNIQAMASNDPSHPTSIEAEGNKTWIAAVRYTTPSFNGISATYETDQADYTGYSVQYSGHGATVKYGKEDNGTTEFTAYALAYGMNGLNVKYVVMDNDTEANNKACFVGADYTMGAITVAAAQLGCDVDEGDQSMSVAYALSKSTTAFISSDKDDSENETATYFGVVQKF
jgi:hypothetical protein